MASFIGLVMVCGIQAGLDCKEVVGIFYRIELVFVLLLRVKLKSSHEL